MGFRITGDKREPAGEQRARDIERSNILKSFSPKQTCAVIFWSTVLSLTMFSTLENWMEPSPLASQLYNRQALCSRLSGWASEHLHEVLLMNRLSWNMEVGKLGSVSY